MNKVILMGRLTKDPEMRQTPTGTSVARFTIAVNRRFQREGGQQADFINCVAWRQIGEFVKRYFFKGKMIALEGELQVRTWEGSDGGTRHATEVIVDNVYFCAKEQRTDPNMGYTPPPSEQPTETGFTELTFTDDDASEDDLPF